MTTLYELRKTDGSMLAILEAADLADATLYTNRNLLGRGWDQQFRTPSTNDDLNEAHGRLADSLGYTGSMRDSFVRGRGGETRSFPVTRVPRQESSQTLREAAAKKADHTEPTSPCPGTGCKGKLTATPGAHLHPRTCPECKTTWVEGADGKPIIQESARPAPDAETIELHEVMGSLADALGLSESAAKTFAAGRN